MKFFIRKLLKQVLLRKIRIFGQKYKKDIKYNINL